MPEVGSDVGSEVGSGICVESEKSSMSVKEGSRHF